MAACCSGNGLAALTFAVHLANSAIQAGMLVLGCAATVGSMASTVTAVAAGGHGHKHDKTLRGCSMLTKVDERAIRGGAAQKPASCRVGQQSVQTWGETT